MPLHAHALPTNSSLSSTLRVLVAEGSWHVAKIIERTLAGLGVEVIGPVASAAEAERLLVAHAPHLAVVDIRLRGGMACSLIERMHEAGVCVVAVSCYSLYPVSTETIAAVLHKPFSETDLIDTIRGLLRNGSRPPSR
jgi:DNA-binding response OmpR family regulator